jgi:putative redox protein
MKAQMNWIGKMGFEIDNHGIKTRTDATVDVGGEEKAPTPKELVLNAMMGCTAMDVVAIMKKMRQVFDEFRLEIDAEKTETHPMYFKSAVIKFYMKGAVAPDKLIKAVESSLTKYCGVNYMISKTCDISFQIFLNSEEIKTGKADFSSNT